MDDENNAAIAPYLVTMYSHAIESLSYIAEKNNDLRLAIQYMEKLPQALRLPLEFRFLFIHKNDDQQFEAQFQKAETVFPHFLESDANNWLWYQIYGLTLIASANIKKGIETLEKIPIEFTSLIGLLQLCIGYYFGFDDIVPDKEKAQRYCDEIQKRLKEAQTIVEKSYFFVEGYMKIFGICCKKDVATGLQLIEKSESALEDIYISTDDLFPTLKQVKEEWEKELDDLANSLSAPQSKSTPKKNSIKKGKANSAKQKSQQATSSNQPSVESVTPAEPAATALTPENWNNYFAPFFSDEDDGSRVVSIDVKNKKFIINDPSRHENLIAFASKIPHFSFKNIGKLDFDKRIIERQAADLDETTRHSHSFARMLDYVIQYVGDIVPFLQLGKDVKTTLNAQVIRQDTNTGLEIPCTAEYTFGKNFNATRTNNFPVIYHRLLRANKRQPAQPIKKKLLINQASSSNQK